MIEALKHLPSYYHTGYFFSTGVSQIWCVSAALKSGMVGVNETSIQTSMVPHGGIKQSRMGYEGAKYGIQEYLNLKYLCLGGLREKFVL